MAITRIRTAAMRLAVGAVVIAAGITGAASPAIAAGSICPLPTPMAVPVAKHVVGTGTAGSCTQAALRSAIAAGGAITFACGAAPATIRLTRTLSVTRTTVLDGGGAVMLDGGGTTRLISVANSTTLSVRNTTLVNGAATGQDFDGSGAAIRGAYRSTVEVIGSTFARNTATGFGGAVSIASDSRLTLVRSTFANNRADLGGAVYSLLSAFTAYGSTFTKNRVTGSGDGGAIYTDGAAPREASTGGRIAVCRSSITDNTASGGGGGAFLWGYQKDDVVVYRSTFARNAVGGNGEGLGGGARIGLAQEGAGRTGTIALSRVAFVGNRSGGSGGAIYFDCAPGCAVRNATFSGNTAGAYGGAIYGDGHSDNGVTYVGNRAEWAGGALAGKRLVLRNTVITGNTAGNQWRGSLACTDTNTGADVLQWGTGGRDGSTLCVANPVQQDPKLAALAQNGGGVPTALPAAGSPVLGKGTGCLPTDARGIARPAQCDLGAAERTD